MILAAVLAAAAQRPAAASPSPQRCRWEEKVGDATLLHLGSERDCSTWQLAQDHVGIWIYQFEGSRFVAGARTLEEAEEATKHGRHAAWFSFDERSKFPSNCRPVLAHAYYVIFVGRDAVPKEHPWPAGGGFGHMGLWSSEVLLDRSTSIVDLGELSGEQVEALGAVSHCPVVQER